MKKYEEMTGIWRRFLHDADGSDAPNSETIIYEEEVKMKKRFLAVLLMGIMLMPQAVHSEELSSDMLLLSDEAALEEQELLCDEIPGTEDEESSCVFDFEDDLTSEAVPSMVSASNVAVEKAYQKYIEILNRPYDENELRYDKFALVYL